MGILARYAGQRSGGETVLDLAIAGARLLEGAHPATLGHAGSAAVDGFIDARGCSPARDASGLEVFPLDQLNAFAGVSAPR